MIGVGAAACVACCAVPIAGFLAAASAATLLGIALFGAAGLVAAVVAALLSVRRRRARADATCGAELEPVPVALGRKPDA